MAQRPIFTPTPETFPYVAEKMIEFEWHPGFAKTQAQRSIQSLHTTAATVNIFPVLEISSKSPNPLGIALSAFNLKLSHKKNTLTVECAYQGSKVFTRGGPFSDLYFVSSREAKRDERIRNSGDFLAYSFFDEDFPTKPVTAFYDWLYLTALSQNQHLAKKLLDFNGFSDIAFNPKKSINCQARTAALFVSLCKNGEIRNVLKDKEYYLELTKKSTKKESVSSKLLQLELNF